MKTTLPFLLAICLLASGLTHAASTSQISATVTFTLTDIQVGGVSAVEFVDYEDDGPVEAFGTFNEQFMFGGTGFTSGSGFSSQNGFSIDPMSGGDPVAIGDTLALTVDASATANTGFVNRNQIESIGFGFLNFTDDGFGNPETLTFLFDYTVSYTTSLSNDVAGDQAFVRLDTILRVFDDTETTIDLFPQGSMDELFELSFAAGTVTPGDMLSGSVALDVNGSSGFFEFEVTGRTPTNINVIPVPAAAWLFGSALGSLGWVRKKGQ
jgi:hypothetical protein